MRGTYGRADIQAQADALNVHSILIVHAKIGKTADLATWSRQDALAGPHHPVDEASMLAPGDGRAAGGAQLCMGGASRTGNRQRGDRLADGLILGSTIRRRTAGRTAMRFMLKIRLPERDANDVVLLGQGVNMAVREQWKGDQTTLAGALFSEIIALSASRVLKNSM